MIYNGSIDKYKIKIHDKDVTDKVQSFDIFVDIFLLGWTVNINFVDGDNILTTYPIKEFDDVEIYIKTDTVEPCGGVSEKTLKFKIMKIVNQRFLNEHIQEYRLICVSDIIFNDIHKMISKSFKDSTSYDAIKTIIQDNFPNMKVEGQSDSSERSFIIHKQSPINAIQFITKFAVNSETSPDFLTFMTDEETIRFDSFENLFKQDYKFKLRHRPQNMLNESGNYNPKDYLTILNYEIKRFDAIVQIISGHHSTTSYTIDIFNKKVDIKEFEHGDDSSEDKSKQSWESQGQSTSLVYAPTTGEDIYKDGDWTANRMSALMKLNQYVTSITLYGSVCLLDMLGSVINISAPPMEDISGENEDKYVAGDHLVTAIRFHVRPNYCRVYMDLNKKRLLEKPKRSKE